MSRGLNVSSRRQLAGLAGHSGFRFDLGPPSLLQVKHGLSMPAQNGASLVQAELFGNIRLGVVQDLRKHALSCVFTLVKHSACLLVKTGAPLRMAMHNKSFRP